MSNIANFFKGLIPDSSTPHPQTNTQKHSKKPSKNVYDNEDKIKITGNFSFFFDFKVLGKSIFQNLVITASGYVFNQFKEKEVIPLKYIWKRVNGQSTRYMEEINSNSYIPTAEDIGHTIELEAYSLDQNSEVAYASFGPISLDDDMKNTLELLLSAGGTKFSCFLYNLKENEKNKDKEVIVYISPTEIKLTETFFDGKEQILEQVKYHNTNPKIRLHPFDIKRLSLTFYDYNFDNLSKSNVSGEQISEKVKSEYHLVAMSKQCRELIYLLLQCFLIDDKLKNNKLFSSLNYNYLTFDSKIGVLDLISELKSLREENAVLLCNSAILENDNLNLKREMADLEMDTQITLQAIKSSHYGNLDSTPNLVNNNSNSISNLNSNNISNNITVNISNDNFNVLKKKFEVLSIENTTLLSKEKAVKENMSKLTLESEIARNGERAAKDELLLFKNMNNSHLIEIASLEKSLKYTQEKLSEVQKESSKIKDENSELTLSKNQFDELKRNDKDGARQSKDYLELKANFEKIEKVNKSLSHEKEQLMNIKNLLQSQKDTLSKEFEKLRKERTESDGNLGKISGENAGLLVKISELEEKGKLHFQNEVSLKKEISNLKSKLDVMEIQLNTFKMTANSTEKGHFISEEDYDYFESLRREKDESDALILKLQSNDLAKQNEIEELKKKLESIQI